MLAPALRLICSWALLLVGAAQAADVMVHASRRGEVLLVEASAEFDADVRETWQVLTDYDHLAEFIPGMRVSRVLARTGNSVLVEQKGEARLLFFSFPIAVRLAIDEFPHKQINSRAVAGDFREMVGAYYLEAGDRRIRLRYSGRMTPDFLVPPLIGTFVLRTHVERQFSALVDEIVRRHHALRPAPPHPGS
ncbi:MAG: hypothetical protein A3G24_13965 [Betaproteobacteria bacterium RIFCSPLOWO2_12_FULL_62_13]|nr:MAG: hypothetical protein A3G24_13965 [Betaproteobacteria bacterium RIFCSPLOWO2_12_FULL_62_13]